MFATPTNNLSIILLYVRSEEEIPCEPINMLSNLYFDFYKICTRQFKILSTFCICLDPTMI